MRKLLLMLLASAVLSLTVLRTQTSANNSFDYYVLSLSWSPNWCLREGDAKKSPQCEPRETPEEKLGWILHGLWPQFEHGWPQYCDTAQRPPSRSDTAKMQDIMGTSGLAWHQWKKHGTCSALSSDAYFALSREAYEAVNRPAVLRKLPRAVTLPASVIEDAFLEANPQLEKDMVTVTCKSEQIQEVRICLSKDLTPKKCGQDVRQDCQLSNALIAPLR